MNRNRYPFTQSQWQELEHQALIFKYIISGMPIPHHLLYTLKTTTLLDSSLSSNFILHHPPHQIEWSCYEMGLGRKIDPEPGRCRRTDGKKWRCSKEAYGDSKYCERHMHRGRNRSRKPVEINTKTGTSSFYTRRTNSASSSSSSITTTTINPFPIPSPHQYNNGFHNLLLSQENICSSTTTTNFLLESTGKGYSRDGVEERKEEEVNELPFFCETSGTMRNISTSQTILDSSQYSPLKKQRSYSEEFVGHSSLQLQTPDHKINHYFPLDSIVQHPKKVMHHFLEEWPLKDKDCSSNIHLSISMPNTSSHYF